MNNDFEILANTVFVNEFDSDTDMATLSQISGWFENNLGELNTVIFTSLATFRPCQDLTWLNHVRWYIRFLPVNGDMSMTNQLPRLRSGVRES